ncbi:hypothetical protein FVR03_18170 [Pontibacter qinzhouensis]|uniref:DUF1574 domain-containing protein n=1 Tax=Pontibacter qinzhouensis TaxID=2603253 RepID=A0A5C8JA49_9BACT|nr:hypothetical protein [Pontibacter qinzhouensis]TXK33886.1 hypothetical protein FVR03_18170 [Pontibacter qinzhouensis]
MKKLLLRILLFLFTLPVTYLLVIAFLTFTNLHNLFNVRLNPAGTGSTMIRVQEAAQTGAVDFLFIGSSHAYRGFDPRVFAGAGYSSFNLGTTAQSPINSYYLLQEHLPHLRPKYLVMEVYWEVLQETGAEASIDLLSNAPLNRTMAEMAVAAKDVSIFNTLVASAIRRWQTPLRQITPTHNEAEETYVAGGFVSTNYTKQQTNLNKLKPTEAKLNSEQLAYLEQIIQLARQHDAIPIFVIAPVTKELKATVQNYSSFKEELLSLLKNHHAPLLDFNNGEYDLNLSSKTDFYDHHHLTQTGVTKFNSFFIKTLQTEELLIY